MKKLVNTTPDILVRLARLAMERTDKLIVSRKTIVAAAEEIERLRKEIENRKEKQT